MENLQENWIRVAPLEELQSQTVLVVRGAECPIAVFAADGRVAAVDNRCPHLGFPLHRGTVQDGILTCHWHNARFDLCSGCTFDPFADDVPAFDVEVRDGVVFVTASPRRAASHDYYLRRLREGMEQNISLIQAKSLLGLLKMGVSDRDIVREIALYGARNRSGWGPGLTLLTAVAKIGPHLEEETRYLALYQGARQVAADCAGQAPRRSLQPLDSDELDLATLKRWLRYWTEVRHREGAERTLLTAIHNGATSPELAELLFTAATDRFYADGGHLLDFCNKAFELLDIIGWECASEVLPTLVPQLVSARGGEEMNAWRHPIDMVPPLRALDAELPRLFEAGANRQWNDELALSAALLGDNPLSIIDALREAIRAGAQPKQLSRALTHAAAMRVARFGTANDVGDWITPLHTFTYCNAVAGAIHRCESPAVVRGIFHGAMSVYLDRFLNVPPTRLPDEREALLHASSDGATLLQQFLDHLDQRHDVEAAARVVAQYLRCDYPLQPLYDTLTQATAREDVDFHSYQMLEAGIQQYGEWGEDGRHIPIAMARYLAAHSPTQRARFQTARIALRLHRGDNLYEDEAN